MKKNSQYASLDNVQINKKHIEHKYFNKKPNRGYRVSNIQTNFAQDNYPSYNSIQTDINNSTINSINNLSSGKFTTYNNTEYFYRDSYQMHSYQPNENEEYKGYSTISMHLKPFTLISKSNEQKYNIINNENNNENSEEQNYPSNYSYHESKCIKKKKKIPINNNSNTNFTILYSTGKSNNNKQSNKSLIQSHAISNNVNNRYKTNNSPYISINKNESFYNNIPTKTINSIITSDNKKKNIVLKKIYKMDEIRPFNQPNNSFIKTIVHQPRSSNIFYSNNKDNTPKHNEKEKSSYKYEKKSVNIPSKSTENITFNKFKFSNSKNEKETLHTSKKNYDNNIENKITITEPSLNKILNTPKQKNYAKNNAITDNYNKYKNNAAVSIRNTNYRNIIKNIDFMSAKKPVIREHYKKNSEAKNIFKEKSEIKTEKLFKEKINKIPNINDIKKKSSSSSNNIISTIIYRKTNS